MARLVLALLLALNVTVKATFCLILETPRNGNVGISGGHRINIQSAPYMAALFLEGAQWCGASVIDEQFVLTAAHCIVTNTTDDWKVLLGSDQLSTEGIFIEVDKILCHEEFDYSKTNHDICLLKLKEEIPLDCFWTVEKIALPKDNRMIYGNSPASVIGWGRTEHENQISNELREASVPLVDNKCCRRVHPNITDDMICAGDNHNNFCRGDAGGPLVLFNTNSYYGSSNPMLIGVASQDASNCNTYPGVYTRVASYLSWIQNTMNSNRI